MTPLAFGVFLCRKMSRSTISLLWVALALDDGAELFIQDLQPWLMGQSCSWITSNRGWWDWICHRQLRLRTGHRWWTGCWLQWGDRAGARVHTQRCIQARSLMQILSKQMRPVQSLQQTSWLLELTCLTIQRFENRPVTFLEIAAFSITYSSS